VIQPLVLLAALSLSAPWKRIAPGVDAAHQLICVGHGPTADTVLVNGRIVMRGGRSTLMDEAAVFAEARASVARMVERLGLKPPGLWPRPG